MKLDSSDKIHGVIDASKKSSCFGLDFIQYQLYSAQNCDLEMAKENSRNILTAKLKYLFQDFFNNSSIDVNEDTWSIEWEIQNDHKYENITVWKLVEAQISFG